MHAPSSVAHPPTHLRIVPEVSRASSSHRTMIEDDVVEAVATCGLAALGLYSMLSRRVNREGITHVSYQGLADSFGQTKRHIMETMAKLESAGFVVVQTQTNRFGMTIANAFLLPHHVGLSPRTDGGEPTSEPTSEVTSEPSCARRLKEVDKSKKEVGSRTRKTSTLLAPDWEPPTTLRDWAPTEQIDPALVDRELPKFRDHYQAKGERRADWTLTFKNWLRNSRDWSVTRAPRSAGRDIGLTTDQLMALALGGES